MKTLLMFRWMLFLNFYFISSKRRHVALLNHLWTNCFEAFICARWLTQSTLELGWACKCRWGSCCLRGRSSWDCSRCCCSGPTVARWRTRRRGRRGPRRWWRCSRSRHKGKWGSLWSPRLSEKKQVISIKIETEDMNHIQVPATVFIWRTSEKSNSRMFWSYLTQNRQTLLPARESFQSIDCSLSYTLKLQCAVNSVKFISADTCTTLGKRE